MNENDPRPGDSWQDPDATTRIPQPADTPPEHLRFGPTGPEHTAPLPQPVPAAPAAPRRAGVLGAGVLSGALLLGGIGGVAGAAGYDAFHDDPTTGTSASRSTLASNAQAVARQDKPPAKGSPAAVAGQVLPSVVKINVAGADGAGSGSGVVLSSDGEILTNNHVVAVIENGGKMTVDFNDGTSATATVVGTDPVSDLAVIRAKGVSGLTPAQLGDSDSIDVGEGVVAIGSPFGLEATVTSGIVSALNRPVSVPDQTGTSSTDTTYPAIQTDAAINPGNSGGPLVNLQGQVVGINSSIRSSSTGLGGESGSIGLGFAIPITTVLPIVDQLRNGDTPTHARLGVRVEDTASQNGLVTGAVIRNVDAGQAGDDAGIQSGDIVIKVDDEPITSSESLVATVRGYRPGDQVTLSVRRGGETQQLKATLGSDQDSSQP